MGYTEDEENEAEPAHHSKAGSGHAGEKEDTLMTGDAFAPVAALQHPSPAVSLDALRFIRLIQCPQCHKPFSQPVTLPCGHSLCKACLPPPHLREHISYPDTPGRRQGYLCPVRDCSWDHPVAECSIDVVLLKFMGLLEDELTQREQRWPELSIRLDCFSATRSNEDYGADIVSSDQFCGSCLTATYRLAQKQRLREDVSITYHIDPQQSARVQSLDEELVVSLRDKCQKELDCHVCYNIMCDPVTTPCGHTFCRKCLARVLDHSSLCPICRRHLTLPPSLDRQPSNVRTLAILETLCSDLISLRREAIAQEESGIDGELDTPLFVCALAFPSMPTFLHIFEPRYRLMIRRAIEGNGQFGMLLYNRHRLPQGNLGRTDFLEYGTMLRILNAQVFPDGRSLIETVGIGRFRVLAHGSVDGYTVGRVEKVEDVSMAEEERLEAEETTAALAAIPVPSSPTRTRRLSTSPGQGQSEVPLESMSTQQLLARGIEFIARMQARSAPWLHQRILDAYGRPPMDAALFPYWFASVLPIAEEEKYLLLKTTSVRERLKIVVGWVLRTEGQRW